MNLNLSADSLLRAGSGILFVVVGLLVAILAARGPRAKKLGSLSLAVACVGQGGAFVVFNLLTGDPALDRVRIVTASSLWGVAAVGAVAMVATLPRRPMRSERARVALALVLGALPNLGGTRAALIEPDAVAATFFVPGELAPFASSLVLARAITVTGLLGFTALVALRFVEMTRNERTGLALVALGVATYPLYAAGNSISRLAPDAFSLGGISWLLGALATVGLAALWLRAARATGSATARNVALVLLGLVVAGEVEAVALGFQTGALGVVRTVAAALLAIAIVRYDVLGLGLGVRTVRRGTLAAVGLATVLIVAQVAQNFFAAQYGLLIGGVVAGALLFAASPLQRAFERSRGRGTDEHARETYRRALHLALNDGELTPEEEEHLAHLAEHLELAAPVALELKREVVVSRSGGKQKG